MATLKHSLLNNTPLNDLLYLNHLAITEQSETEILSTKTEYRLRYKGSDLGGYYDGELIAVIDGCWSLSEDVRQLNITHINTDKENPLLTVLAIVFIRDFIRAVVGRSAVFTIALDISRHHAADCGILELLMTAQFKDDLNYVEKILADTIFNPGHSPTEFDAFGRVILREAFLDGIKEDWTQYLEARQLREAETETLTTTPLPTMDALTDQIMTSIQAQLGPMIRAELERERSIVASPTALEPSASPLPASVIKSTPADGEIHPSQGLTRAAIRGRVDDEKKPDWLEQLKQKHGIEGGLHRTDFISNRALSADYVYGRQNDACIIILASDWQPPVDEKDIERAAKVFPEDTVLIARPFANRNVVLCRAFDPNRENWCVWHVKGDVMDCHREDCIRKASPEIIQPPTRNGFDFSSIHFRGEVEMLAYLLFVYG